MKKVIFVVIFLFSSFLLNAHPFKEYVLNTKDSYVNLREKPSTKAKILQRLNVEGDEEEEEDNFSLYLKKEVGDWYYFEVSYGLMDASRYGYIHKSQVKLHPNSYIVNSKKGYVYLNNEAKEGTEGVVRLENGSYVTKQGDEENGWYMVQHDDFNEGDAPWGYIKKKDLKKAIE